jgi:hypothetical protein
MGNFDMSGKTSGYWEWIHQLIIDFVETTKAFYAVISGFVDGFKNHLTVSGDPDPMWDTGHDD